MNKPLLVGGIATLLAAGVAVAAPALPKHGRPVSVAALQQRSAERFKALDTNSDGSLSKAEMDSARDKRGAKRGAHGGGHHSDLFGRADADRNGVVTRLEYDAALARHAGHRAGRQHATPSDAQRKERAAAMFKRMDANADGSISKAEAVAARTRFDARRGEAHEQRVGDRFARLDTDHNGAVSLAEFNSRLVRLDSNHDGQISPNEFAAARAAFRATHGERR